MDIPLQITFRGLRHSDLVDALIRQRAGKLARFSPHISSCRVVVELPDRHKQHGRQFVVRIDLKVRDGEIAINRDHDEDVKAAVREAFDAVTRKLEDHVREERGDVKAHATRAPLQTQP